MMRLALPVAAALLSLAACSGTPGPQTSVQPVPEVTQEGGGVPEVDQSSDPTDAPAAGSDQAAAKAYFEAIVTNDPESMADALKYAAPKSVAEAYAKHQVNAYQANLDGGVSSEPDTLESEGEDGTYGYCPSDADPCDASCASWENVRFSGGKVVDFTVKKVDISKRITLGSGDKVKAGKLADVTFLSAYQSVASKSLFVVVNVKSHDKKIDLSNAYSATYRDPTGRQAEATDADGPGDLGKDSNGDVAMIFKNAKPGGVVTLDIYASDDYENDHTVKIKTA